MAEGGGTKPTSSLVRRVLALVANQRVGGLTIEPDLIGLGWVGIDCVTNETPHLIRKWFLTARRNRKISTAEYRFCRRPRKEIPSGIIGGRRDRG